MRIHRSNLVGAATLALLALPLGASEGAMEYRQHTMAAVGGHTTALFDILTGKVEHTGHLAAHATPSRPCRVRRDPVPGRLRGRRCAPGHLGRLRKDFAERLSAFEAAATT